MSGIDLFSVMLSEDDILRAALQEIWEIGQEPSPVGEIDPTLQRIFTIVNDAVDKLNTLAELRKQQRGSE